MPSARGCTGLPHRRGGGYHALRRAWATRRKHLSLTDVAAAGGWQGTQVLQSLYQRADQDTLGKCGEGPLRWVRTVGCR